VPHARLNHDRVAITCADPRRANLRSPEVAGRVIGARDCEDAGTAHATDDVSLQQRIDIALRPQPCFKNRSTHPM
jgi:hypothetical protein